MPPRRRTITTGPSTNMRSTGSTTTQSRCATRCCATRPGDKMPAPRPPPPPPRSPPPPPSEPQRRAPGPPPKSTIEGMVESVTAEADTSLEIEHTSLADERDSAATGGVLDGFETTTVEFDDREVATGDAGAPLVRDGADVEEGVARMAELEPTVPEEPA